MWTWKTKLAPAAATIVIVHGSGEHHGRYHWLKGRFLSEGFHVVMGDLPGQGRSARRRGHIDRFDEYIETIASWVEHAAQLKQPVFVVAHSLGGLAAVRTMTEKTLPVAGLLLSSPCFGLARNPPSMLKMIAKVLNVVAPGVRFPIKSSTKNARATRNEAVLQRDEIDDLIVKKVSVRWFHELEKAMRLAFLTIDDFPDLPLLVLQAGEDLIVSKYAVRRWFNRLKGTDRTYKEWPGLYHEIFNEPEREQVFRYALHFIRQHCE